MILHIKDDLYQIGEHVPNEYGFEAMLSYVLLNDGNPILIDCGSHIHRESYVAEIDQLLEGATPEYLFLTHSELPHAGNIAAVAEKWPDIKVIVSNVMLPYIEVLPVLPLEQITQVVPGTKIEFPTRTIEFVDALLKDQPGSHWIHDPRTQTLFTGDGFGYFNDEATINTFPESAENGISVKAFQQYHKIAFRFLRWIRPDRLAIDLRKMFTKREIKVIAPIHGNAIRGEVPLHLDRMISALEAVKNSYAH